MEKIVFKYINGYKIFSFSSRKEILNHLSYCNYQGIFVAMNAEKILKNDSSLKRIVNDNIGYPDGIGAVWALKKKGEMDTIKIPGTELWIDIVKDFYKTKTFYLIGSKKEVVREVSIRLKKEFANIRILGFRDGFIKDDNDFQDLIARILVLKPDVIFVAQGSPLQEFTMDRLNKIYPAIYIGLGGSFDIYSGLKKRAPEFFLKNNLEWLYRLLKEPLRIKRQWILFKFLILLSLNKL